MPDNFPILDGVVAHTVNLLRVAGSERAAVLKMLQGLESSLIKDLEDVTGKTPLNVARLKALLAQTSGTISTAYDAIAKHNGKTLSKIAQLEATKTVNVVNDALNVAVTTVGHTPAQLAAIASKVLVNGKHPSEWWKDQDASTRDRFATAMREGMLKGESIDDLARRVRGTKDRGYTNGIMQVSKAQAEALVRTSVLTTANTARIESLKANGDVVKGIQWIATLDSRTTPICRALDGLQWTLPDLKPVGHDKAFPGPTAHWNCRSTQIPVTRSWDELAGPKAKLKTADGETGNLDELLQKKLVAGGMDPEQAAKVKADTRASMDGQVPTMDFDAWLKTKPEDFQDSLLGPQRAAMWRNGQVTMRQMTDQDNNPLTVEDLKALVAANAHVAPPAEGENGLSLAQRKLLQDSMRYGVEQSGILTHYLDVDTGNVVTVHGTNLDANTLAQIKAMKRVHVLQNSLAAGEVWTAPQWAAFGALPNFHAATIVGPTGRFASVAVKPGQVFDSAAAEDVMAKFAALKNTKTIPQTQQKFQSAVSKNGTLKFTLSEAGAVKLPADTFNQKFPELATKPAPFFDAEAEAAKQTAEAARTAAKVEAAQKAAAQAALVAAQEKAANLALEKRAAEVAANAEALAARKAANDAIAALDAAEKAAAEAQAKVDAANHAAQAEIADVLANPTGKTLLAKNLAKLMKGKPGLAPADLLAEAKEAAIADQKAASTAAALSGYKKKVLEGKEPTPAQKKALDSLTPEDKSAWLMALEVHKALAEEKALAAATAQAATEAAKKAAAAEAVAVAKPVVPVTPPPAAKPPAVPVGFPADPNNLTVVRRLGGSTGAELVKDKAGNLFVRKAGASPGHVREEAIADAVYRGLGLDVPEFQLFETPTGPVKLARFIEGKTLGDYLKTATPAKRAAVIAEIRKGFAADALMGNWDAAGRRMDNILVDAAGKPWRIDNGGSLRYRATGPQKTASEWNEFATELWTMRGVQITTADKATKLSAQTTELFGGVSIYDIARQIRQLPTGAFDSAPDEVRTVLEKRLGHLQALATRALDFEATKWNATTADHVTRQSMALRERGVVQRMAKRLDVKNGAILVDENGKEFDDLRTRRMAGGAAANVNAPDPYADTFLGAIISINAHHKKATGQFANPSKVQAVMGLETTLKTAAAGADPAKKALAEHYLAWLDKIKAAQKAFGTPGYKAPAGDILPKFDNTAGTKIVQKFKAPETVQPVKPRESLTADVSAYMEAEGVTAQPVHEWMSSQAGSSWSTGALPLKWWVSQNHPGVEYWWGAGGKKTAENAFNALAARVGGVDKLNTIYSTWVAYTQEVLTNTWLPNKDDVRRLVRLIRTEESDVMTGNKIPLGQYGGTYTIKKGASESHSVVQLTRVFGYETTVQAVPFSEVFGLYLTERPGWGTHSGSGGAGFLGDGENEFVASSNQIPFVYVGRAQRTGGPLVDGSAEWKARLAPGHNDGNDASKWGVPIDHWTAP